MRILLSLAVLAAALPAAAQRTGWGAAIRPNLALIGGPAAFAARNLERMDLSSDYTVRVVAPLGAFLEGRYLIDGKPLSEAVFAGLPEAKRVDYVRAALEAQVEASNGRASGILKRVAEETLSPEDIVDDAKGAEDLLLMEHPFLKDGNRDRLVVVHPLLQKQAAAYQARVTESRMRSTIRSVMANAEARAEDALGEPAKEEEADPDETQASGSANYSADAKRPADAALPLMKELAGLAKAAGKQKAWAEATRAVRKAAESGDLSDKVAARALVDAASIDLWEHVNDAFLDKVGRGKRAVPADASETLKKLELLLAKAAPRFTAALGAAPSPEERSREVVELLGEMRARASDYIMSDEKLSPDQWTARASAWAAAMDPFVGYPRRRGPRLAREDARDILRTLSTRLKEYRSYVETDFLLAADRAAKSTVLAQADALVDHLKALAKG